MKNKQNNEEEEADVDNVGTVTQIKMAIFQLVNQKD